MDIYLFIALAFTLTSCLLTSAHPVDRDGTYDVKHLHVHSAHQSGDKSLIQQDEEDEDLNQTDNNPGEAGDINDEKKVYFAVLRRPEEDSEQGTFGPRESSKDNSSDTIAPYFSNLNKAFHKIIETGNRAAHRLISDISKMANSSRSGHEEKRVEERPLRARKRRSVESLLSAIPSFPSIPAIPMIPAIPSINGQAQPMMSPSNQIQDIVNMVRSIASDEVKALGDLYSNISSSVIAQTVNGTNITVAELFSVSGFESEKNGSLGLDVPAILATPASNHSSQANRTSSLRNGLPIRSRRTVDSLWPMLMNPSLVLPDANSLQLNFGLDNLHALDAHANGTDNSTLPSAVTISEESQSNSTLNSSSPIQHPLSTKRMRRNIAYIPTASGVYKPMMMAWTPYGPMLMPLLKSPDEEMSLKDEMRSTSKYDRYEGYRPSVLHYKLSKRYRPSKSDRYDVL